MEWLAKIRSQSEATKTKLAIIFAAAITLLIVALWLLIMRNGKTSDEVVTKSKSNELKPLFMIFKTAKEDFKEIKTDIKTQKASTVEATTPSANVLE